ncbi:MAG: Xaa-Pro dipeptidyl-peptidase [Planctomycetota bacterium]
MKRRAASGSGPTLFPLGLALGLALPGWSSIAQAQAVVKTDERAVPIFVDGEAQVVPAFKDKSLWVQHDLWVETEFDSDGDGKLDRMHVDVTRPLQTDSEGLKVAVIYQTSPYFSGIAGGTMDFFWNPSHELGEAPPPRKKAPDIEFQPRRTLISRSLVSTWVPRGFAVVHSSSPGTGRSEGCPTVGGINESLAPKAVIDWLNGRAKGYTLPDSQDEVKAYWSTGKVGMTGTSYEGTLPLAAATTGVEGLEAIIPISPNTSYYHYYRSNGLVRHPGGYMGEDVDVLYDFVHSGDPAVRDACNAKVRDTEMAQNQDRLTGDYNDFWASRDYLNVIDKVKAATLIAHGFNDWNVMPEHSVRIYEALRKRGVPCMAFFHQGGHGGDPTPSMMNRWFSHYLYGVDNGVEGDARAWIVREGAKMSQPTAYADYPNPDAALVALRPMRGGRGLGALALDAEGQGRETLVDDASVDGKTLASAAESEHRLLYATPELAAPLHLSGAGTITLRLASSKPAANLSVWIVSLPWTESRRINDNIITRGWADPQNQASARESKPLVPGEFVSLTFALQPDDQIIPAGQRVGLMVFSSDHDFTLWPAPGTELTIDLDGTTLQLPVVGGRAAYEEAIAR